MPKNTTQFLINANYMLIGELVDILGKNGLIVYSDIFSNWVIKKTSTCSSCFGLKITKGEELLMEIPYSSMAP
jgi:hypothetical protein